MASAVEVDFMDLKGDPQIQHLVGVIKADMGQLLDALDAVGHSIVVDPISSARRLRLPPHLK